MTGAEVAGPVLAIPGLVELSIKYAETLRNKVELFMEAEEHSRLQGFIVDLTIGQINDILLFVKEVGERLPLDFVKQLSHAIKVLNTALQSAVEAFPPDSWAQKKN